MVVLPLILFVGCLSCALAQRPVATASSGEGFEVNGVRVPVAGLPSWPVMAGDTISTGKAPAVISFGDQGRVVLSENSKLQIQSEPDRPSVRLLQGGASVRPEQQSGLGFTAVGRRINAPLHKETMVTVKGTTITTISTGGKDPVVQKPSSRFSTAAGKPTPTPTPTPPPPPSPK